MKDLLAQLVELRTFNAKVADSNSAGVTKCSIHILTISQFKAVVRLSE